MTITKNDPNSEFWKAAAEASRRVAAFPAWKLGILQSPTSPVQNTAATCDEQQAAAATESKTK